MSYINIQCPSYPYFAYSGNAIYRPGDRHRARKGISYFDILAVESGCLYMTVGKESFDLDRGCVLIIPPDTFHCGRKGCPEKTFFRWMHFRTERFSVDELPARLEYPMRRQIAPPPSTLEHYLSVPMIQKIPEKDFELLMELFRQLETRSVDFYKKDWDIFRADSNILQRQELFLRILGMIGMQPERTKEGRSQVARAVLNYMELHYAQPLTLDQIAQEVHCHPTHVIRCMKNEFGLTPMQMLIRLRVRRACELLSSLDESVLEVANDVGFSSPSYFCKQFRKVTGCSPKEYRSSLGAAGGQK